MPETLTADTLDVRVREDFPFLAREVDGKPIIYFDNAATTQKPKAVIDAVSGLYSSGIANVHRAVNFLGDEVTDAFEAAREHALHTLREDAEHRARAQAEADAAAAAAAAAEAAQAPASN